MKLAALLFPPSLDPKQALRLRRFGLASLTYALALALVALAWAFDVLPTAAALSTVAAYVLINVALYAVFRSGFNLRFADPSLTRLQILAAVTLLMFTIYHMDYGRNIALFGCFIIFLFGVFRFDVREFTLVTLYTLAAYALVIDLLMYQRPQAIHEVPLEWMSWLMLAGLLPGFTIIGAQINTLRRRLRNSEARFRSLTEMSSDFYWESDVGHRLTQRDSANRNLSPVSTFRQGAQIGQRRWEIPYMSPDEAGWQAHRAVLDAHQPFRDFELSRLGADGAERFVSISGDPVFDESGAFKGYRGIGTDITARKQAEQNLRDTAEKLRVFADNVPTMTAAFDQNLHYSFTNKAFAQFFGYTPESILGKRLSEVVGDRAYMEVEKYFARALAGHPARYERTLSRENGQIHHIEVKLLPNIGASGEILGCFSVTTDITEHKLSEERIQRVAHHDSLTKLPNRLLFNDRLQQTVNLAKRDTRQFALLYLDLDKFKPVNDRLGHAAGDGLLRAVAERIRSQVRESDTVARVGGDEFTVILPDIARNEEAEIVAKKIIAALALPFLIGPNAQSLKIGSSIGIAVYPADGRDADALVNAADAAMYDAKRAGNSYRFCAA